MKRPCFCVRRGRLWGGSLTIVFFLFLYVPTRTGIGVLLSVLIILFCIATKTQQYFIFPFFRSSLGMTITYSLFFFFPTASLPPFPEVNMLLTGQAINRVGPDRYLIQSDTARRLLTTKQEITLGTIIAWQVSTPRYLLEQTEKTQSYQQWLVLKGYAGHMYPRAVQIVEMQTLPWLFRMRQQMLTHLQKLPLADETKSLLAGMLWGDAAGFSKEQLQLFTQSGLLHIIAVSGSNMTFFALLIYIFVRWLPRYSRNTLVACGLILYACICGLESSIVRALLFALFVISMLSTGYVHTFWQKFFVVATLLLWYSHTNLLIDRGRRLSFGAVGTIALWHEVFTKSRLYASKIIKRGGTYMLPSLAATAGTLPFLLVRNTSYTLRSLFANIGVLFLLPGIIRGGTVLLFITFLIHPPLFMTTILDYLAHSVFSLAQFTVHHSPLLNYTSPQTMYYFLIALVRCIWIIPLYIRLQIFPYGAKKQ